MQEDDGVGDDETCVSSDSGRRVWVQNEGGVFGKTGNSVRRGDGIVDMAPYFICVLGGGMFRTEDWMGTMKESGGAGSEGGREGKEYVVREAAKAIGS